MVTETAPETEVEEPVVTEPEAPASEPETPAPEEEDTSVNEFLQARGLADASAGDQGTGTEGPSPEVLAEAEKLRAAERDVQQRQSQEEGARRDFQARMPRIHSALMEWGLNPQQIQAVENEFNNHHWQSAPTHAFNWTNQLYDNAEKVAPGISKNREQHKDQEAFLKDLAVLSRKGFSSEKDVKARVQKELIEYKKFLEGKGITSNARAPKADGSSSGRGGYTVAQIEAMPTNEWMALGDSATRQQILNEAHARDHR